MTTDGTSTTGTRGLVIHSGVRYYDLLASLLTLGRERAFRERLVELAGLGPGDAILDVGCGTGTLAIAAKRRVGAAGTVYGIDASPEMIDRAKRKAAKAGVDVVFRTGIVATLPYFAVATAPSLRDDDRQDLQAHAPRSLDPLPAPRWSCQPWPSRSSRVMELSCAWRRPDWHWGP